MQTFVKIPNLLDALYNKSFGSRREEKAPAIQFIKILKKEASCYECSTPRIRRYC